MAQTPQTPVHFTPDSDRDDDTPMISEEIKSPITIKPPRRGSTRLSNKQKLQIAFACLYDEKNQIDLQSPSQAWSPGHIVHSISDLTMEDVSSDDMNTFDVKASRNGGPEVEVSANSDTVKDTAECDVRAEWLGTSQFYLEPLLELQRTGGLDQVIAYRDAVAQGTTYSPYDPVPLLLLSGVHGKLGFSDIAVGNAHRAILLIEAAMRITGSSLPTSSNNIAGTQGSSAFQELDIFTRRMISTKFNGLGLYSIQDELQQLHRQAYHMLLAGMLGTGANWEGLRIAKTAQKLYPEDLELRQLEHELKGAFKDRRQAYVEVQDEEELKKADMIEASRMGKIYQKKYPWMDQDLYKRTPKVLRQSNKTFEGISSEVRPVSFGDAKPRVIKEGQDVGPLGIFATQDIEAGKLVMLDKTVTGVSSVPSSRLEHCDACQGSLKPPYGLVHEMEKPSCCGKVVYCSHECYESAAKGYHKVLCGHDFDWLYEVIKVGKTSGAPTHWKSVNFLRIVAVVLADIRTSKVHPLQHPLIARMSANYPPEGKILSQYDAGHQWLYFTNVVAPTRILLQLGVDIYTDPHWSQEVIQTIFWRIENNANMATTELAGTKAHLVCINPNYLFFNHSCQPNVSWHGAVPDGKVGISWLETPEGGYLQPGCSAVWCFAARNIKKGEQLTISYIGNPRGDNTVEGGREAKRAWLSKWFDNGCGCPRCEEENRIEADRASKKEVAHEIPNIVETQTEMEGIVES
ncbi:hypothetical protein ONS95_012102 [Cadophora gregata]|uniref:uncharacterized protein n=1 Tax=Cadophora gregata TaxID=51156 RepID=UPI0026DB3C9F|nr:uncharacterized protein ONS95_012102 [Cadophora gregata]KAK0117777.1 hypothetical protein ONS95_012102 [Cadophora gregata]KAK0122827.1 hypothetical protein ONS96_009859 [Cadophora gregata f. sp. sojae]